MGRPLRTAPDGLVYHALNRASTGGYVQGFEAHSSACLFTDCYDEATWDRLLKGARPSELPVEQLSKIKPVVNLKAAKTPGLTIPESILVRADEVIR